MSEMITQCDPDLGATLMHWFRRRIRACIAVTALVPGATRAGLTPGKNQSDYFHIHTYICTLIHSCSFTKRTYILTCIYLSLQSYIHPYIQYIYPSTDQPSVVTPYIHTYMHSYGYESLIVYKTVRNSGCSYPVSTHRSTQATEREIAIPYTSPIHTYIHLSPPQCLPTIPTVHTVHTAYISRYTRTEPW